MARNAVGRGGGTKPKPPFLSSNMPVRHISSLVPNTLTETRPKAYRSLKMTKKKKNSLTVLHRLCTKHSAP